VARDYKNPPKPARGNRMWLGILLGIALGIAFAAGMAWWLRDALRVAFQPPPVAHDLPAPPPKPIEPEVKPDYDFYELLPQSGASGETTPAPAPERADAAPGAEGYFVQAGSFQDAQDADTLKARLTLLGASVQIQTVDLPDKGRWHRVRLGPYASRAEAELTQKLLDENQIASHILQPRETSPGDPQ
jgi:cell division protein FtsN